MEDVWLGRRRVRIRKVSRANYQVWSNLVPEREREKEIGVVVSLACLATLH